MVLYPPSNMNILSVAVYPVGVNDPTEKLSARASQYALLEPVAKYGLVTVPSGTAGAVVSSSA